MEKRGLSNLVATVLIVILVLAAAVIIWIAIRNLTQKTLMSARDELALIGVRFSIIDTSVVVENERDVFFNLERAPGGENVTAFPVIVLEDSWGYTKSTYKYNQTNMAEYQRIKVEFLADEHGLQGNLKKILLYPALINEEKEIVTSRAPSDVYDIKESGATGQRNRVNLTLIVSPENAGTVVDATGSEYLLYPQYSEYWSGTELYLNAISSDYFLFNWLDENGQEFSRNNPLYLTLNSNRTIIANFTNILYLSGCRELNITGMYYKLTENLTTTGTCFNITANDVVLDGNNNIISGNNATGFFGVVADNVNNATITGLTIVYFDTGVGFFNTKSSKINYNVIALGSSNGVVLRDNSDYNQIIKNIIGYSDKNGIFIQSGSYNNLTSLLVGLNTENGIQISSPAETSPSQNNNLSNNYFLNNTLDGMLLWSGNSNANYFFNNTFYGNINDGVNLTYSNYSTFASNYVCYNYFEDDPWDFYCDNSPTNYGTGGENMIGSADFYTCKWLMPLLIVCQPKPMPTFPSYEAILQGGIIEVIWEGSTAP